MKSILFQIDFIQVNKIIQASKLPNNVIVTHKRNNNYRLCQVDEMPVQVLDKTKKGKTHRGYRWVYFSPLEKTVLFDYHHGRSRESPSKLLKGFCGYLQTDGYKVYDSFGDKKI